MARTLINKPDDFVLESIEGAVASIPHLRRLDGFPQVWHVPVDDVPHDLPLLCRSHVIDMQVKVVFNVEEDEGKVALISGRPSA